MVQRDLDRHGPQGLRVGFEGPAVHADLRVAQLWMLFAEDVHHRTMRLRAQVVRMADAPPLARGQAPHRPPQAACLHCRLEGAGLGVVRLGRARPLPPRFELHVVQQEVVRTSPPEVHALEDALPDVARAAYLALPREDEHHQQHGTL